MIHRDSLPDGLLELVSELMVIDWLRDFFLVGGTALALQLGHRVSIDIDLFSGREFEPETLVKKLLTQFDIQRIHHEPDTVRAIIRGVKVELIWHDYPLIGQPITLDGIRMASLPDLAAMKLNAVSGRGLKKDFWDIAALFNTYNLDEMLNFYSQKYQAADKWHLLKALEYFEDAENDCSEVASNSSMTWQDVKRSVSNAVANYIRL